MNRIIYFFSLLAVLHFFGSCQKSIQADCPQLCDNDSLQHQRKVLLIGIDGCRSDAMMRAHTPNLDRLMQAGKYSLSVNRGDLYTLSGPGWSSMLTGVWPDKHGVTDNQYETSNYTNYPPFLCRVNTKSYCYKIASIVHYKDFNDQIIQSCQSDVVLDYKEDAFVAESATNYLKNCELDIMILHFDQVDYVGHRCGFHPDIPNYLNAIESTDALLGPLMDALYDREINNNEDWLVVVSTDHGGKIDGSHSNQPYDPEVTRVFSIFRNKNTLDTGLMPYDPPIVAIAPTILEHLDIAVDSSWNLDGQAVEM